MERGFRFKISSNGVNVVMQNNDIENWGCTMRNMEIFIVTLVACSPLVEHPFRTSKKVTTVIVFRQ